MKLLITGSAGFVGSHFVQYLEREEKDWEVLGIDKVVPTPGPVLNHVRLSRRAVDLLDSDALQTILEDARPDFILHLASYSSVGYSWANPVESFRNNTNAFLNLIEAARQTGSRSRILSVGSSEEYGVVPAGRQPITESERLAPISPYAIARVAQEHISKLYAESYGLDIVMTRSFNHLGPGQSETFAVSSFAKQLSAALDGTGQRVAIKAGDTSVVRDLTDVRDVVRAYYALFHDGKAGEVYNVCSGTGRSFAEVLELLAEISGRRIEVLTDPSLLRPVENAVVVGSYAKLQRETGWHPEYELRQSLADVLRYWQQREKRPA